MVCIKADPGLRTKDGGGVLNVTRDSVAPAPYALSHSDCGLDIKALAVLGEEGGSGARLEPGLLRGISVSQGEERGCGTNTCYVVNRVPESHGNHTQHGLTH